MQQNDGRVVSNFIVNALKQKKIIINGQGRQTRSFCYIDDLIIALIKLMNKNSKFNGPFNIGNPEEYNVRQLASIVLKLTKSKSKIHYSKMQLNDPKKRKPDISKFSKTYKWKPKISLDNGLLKTIKYFKEIQ
jgi:UDP-glucuronate decarboxylase